MAKRYIRINNGLGWVNKPSTATPVGAGNLGHMEDGIVACDEAIEEIYNKRVNNVVTTDKNTFLAGPVGKYLQDQISELNKNLANKTSKEYTGTVAGDFKNTLVETWNTIPVGMSMCLLEQGSIQYAVLSKLNDTYGAALVFGYSIGNAPQYGVLNNGTWTWKSTSLV